MSITAGAGDQFAPTGGALVEMSPRPADRGVQARRATWYKNPALMAGLIITGIVLIAAIIAPLITFYNPITQNLTDALQGPSAAHWLGTDQFGRDTWTRLVYGARLDLRIAFIAVLFPFTLGVVLGSIAGYFGGWADTIIMRVVDVVVAFPFYVLVIAVVFALGAGVKSIFIAVTAVAWVSYTRIVRGDVLVAKRIGYVQAARAAGLSTPRILSRHLLPNVLTQALIYATSDIVLTILAIVTLGFLGLGVQPPAAEWGGMMQTGKDFLSIRPLLVTAPGIAVVLTGLALSLIGDGLAAELGRLQ